MTDGDRHEVWRTEYVKDAYSDQTGKKHWGYIVHARTVLTETGRFSLDDGYGHTYPTAGVVAIDGYGREFRYYPNLIDYHGGGSWKCVEDGTRWQRPPYSPSGYVHPDGTGPVERLLPRP